ncbi:IS30 family transposase [Spiroplasma citri]|uniref:IS30 family transposase n=1 Tax=Spiroplasma citri TaxID=2133 RepID=UPI00148B0451|nr:IS30 family transposase [Spiroplasma citri]
MNLKKFKEYDPLKLQKQYLKNRKNSKKHITLTVKQIKWLNKNFNTLHSTPETICKMYEIEFGEKFPMCFKTLYKYIYLGLFNMDKKYLYFKWKKRKTKNSTDNRGKLSNYRTIEEAKHDRYEFGWFQMDCIVGADHKSAVLTFTEELTKFTIAEKLREQTAEEVVKTIKNIFVRFLELGFAHFNKKQHILFEKYLKPFGLNQLLQYENFRVELD